MDSQHINWRFQTTFKCMSVTYINLRPARLSQLERMKLIVSRGEGDAQVQSKVWAQHGSRQINKIKYIPQRTELKKSISIYKSFLNAV